MSTPTFKALLFRGDELLVHSEAQAFPDASLAEALGLEREHLHRVTHTEQAHYHAGWLPRECGAPEGHEFKKLRAIYIGWDAEAAALAGAGYQVAEWARTHRFCGHCGSPTELLQGERCLRCVSCRHSAYPRISPAMMVLIRKGNQVLLGLAANSPTGRWSALAGFLEAGESIEQCVHREVFEEVGLKVHQLQYFSSQSWPFPHSLMIAFTAEYLSGDIQVDPSEIAQAGWFGPDDEWPEVPAVYSVAGRLIRDQRDCLPPHLRD